MLEILKNNLFIRGTIHSSKAGTARSFILVLPRPRTGSVLMCMYNKGMKHVHMYTYIDKQTAG